MSANLLKSSSQDTFDDSPSSIAEEIGDNDTNDDDIENISEQECKIAIETKDDAVKAKGITSRSRAKPEQKQKATVIKAKSASPINGNSKLKARAPAKPSDKYKKPDIEATSSPSKNSSGIKAHEAKSIYAPPASPTTSSFNTLKTDLPGRVSFSKNDVYEIDYSDIDNDTDTSRSLDLNEPFRKKNVHFEDEYFNKFDDDNADHKKTTFSPVRSSTVESNNLSTDDKEYCPLKCNSLRCKADMRLDVLPEVNENGSGVMANDSSEKIIEDYKREIEHLNRQHELERKWNESKLNGDASGYSEYLTSDQKDGEQAMKKDEWNSGSESWSSPNHEPNNLKSKHTTTSNTSDESPTRDSASTVINNYLKITNQKSSASKPSSATIKLKTTKKFASTANRKIKSAQAAAQDPKPSRLTKAKSVGHLQRITDIKLSEFQIDKVESWMSTHEDTFSDTGLNSYRKFGKFGSSSNLDYKKTWRETPTSKTDDEGNYSLDDQVDNTSMDGSIGGGIELVLKKLEGRRMQISFGNLTHSHMHRFCFQ